jgi:Subtilase family
MPDGEESRFWKEYHRIQENARRRDERARQKGRDSKAGPGSVGARVRSDEEIADFLYVTHEVLVEEDYAPYATQVISKHARVRESDTDVPRLKRLVLDKDAAEVLVKCRDELDPRRVSPRHVADVSGWAAFCPATEPMPVTGEPWPSVHASSGPGRPVVAVIDTGLMPGAAGRFAWLRQVSGETDDEVYLPAPGDQEIAPYGGHGTFVAGIVRCVAGLQARVFVNDALMGGVADELTFVRELNEVLHHDPVPDIVSMSAGLYTWSGQQPLSFRLFFESLSQEVRDSVVLVAAAGNDGTDTPFWPAAYDNGDEQAVEAIGVGALSVGGTARPDWSNHGPWVDVFAPGCELVNAYPKGKYTDVEGITRDYDRLASWSGTSFATPVVTGLIARRMIETGEGAKQAWWHLFGQAVADSVPGIGPRLTV